MNLQYVSLSRKGTVFRKYRAIAICVLSMFLGQPISLHAEGGVNHLILIPATSPSLLEWSTDSHRLVFAEQTKGVPSYEDPDWSIYDVQAGTLSTHNSYPFKPALSAQEAQIFKPDPASGEADDTTAKSMFVSPNGRYLVYGGHRISLSQWEVAGSVWSLMLGDRQTQHVIETSIKMTTVTGPVGLQINWSPDSRSFVLVQNNELTGSTEVIYVTGYDNDITRYATQKQFSAPDVNGKLYLTNTFFSFSQNNRYALIVAADKVTSESQTRGEHLILYDTQDNNLSEELTGIDVGSIDNARFLDSDNSRLLVVNNQGFLLYDMTSRRTQMINASINEQEESALLSPDHQWMAIIDSSGRLYIIQTKYLDLTGTL